MFIFIMIIIEDDTKIFLKNILLFDLEVFIVQLSTLFESVLLFRGK